MMNLKSNAQKDVFNDGLCAICSIKIRHDPIASLRLRFASRISGTVVAFRWHVQYAAVTIRR
jgi:hypothetical protein